MKGGRQLSGCYLELFCHPKQNTVRKNASGEMAVAYFQNHFPKGFWPILNMGERAVFYCFLFLYIASPGAVVWGIDSVGHRRHRPR